MRCSTVCVFVCLFVTTIALSHRGYLGPAALALTTQPSRSAPPPTTQMAFDNVVRLQVYLREPVRFDKADLDAAATALVGKGGKTIVGTVAGQFEAGEVFELGKDRPVGSDYAAYVITPVDEKKADSAKPLTVNIEVYDRAERWMRVVPPTAPIADFTKAAADHKSVLTVKVELPTRDGGTAEPRSIDEAYRSAARVVAGLLGDRTTADGEPIALGINDDRVRHAMDCAAMVWTPRTAAVLMSDEPRLAFAAQPPSQAVLKATAEAVQTMLSQQIKDDPNLTGKPTALRVRVPSSNPARYVWGFPQRREPADASPDDATAKLTIRPLRQSWQVLAEPDGPLTVPQSHVVDIAVMDGPGDNIEGYILVAALREESKKALERTGDD